VLPTSPRFDQSEFKPNLYAGWAGYSYAFPKTPGAVRRRSSMRPIPSRYSMNPARPGKRAAGAGQGPNVSFGGDGSTVEGLRVGHCYLELVKLCIMR